MPGQIYEGIQYRLRAGTPMPIRGLGEFVLHTFMAETNVVQSLECVDSLPSSSEFRGQGGELISASYSRLGVTDGKRFNGKLMYAPNYVEEESIP